MPKILIIDDDAAIRSVLRRALERAGYKVADAGDGRAGLRALNEDGADLVITDLIMPEVEGMELIFGLRKSHPDLPIIAMSGGGELLPETYLPVAERGGARKVFAKPFDVSELVKAVREILPL